MNNSALLIADRGTHFKIVLIARIASMAVSMLGTGGHVRPVSSEALQQRAGAS
jgi:hypothetical protein